MRKLFCIVIYILKCIGPEVIHDFRDVAIFLESLLYSLSFMIFLRIEFMGGWRGARMKKDKIFS